MYIYLKQPPPFSTDYLFFTDYYSHASSPHG